MSFHPETENYRYWTLQEEQQLEQLVKTSKYSFKQIGKILNRTGQSCQDHSRILGFDSKYIQRIYSHDENFWVVPNYTNCLYAGFSAADASIQTPNGKSFTYKLEIQKMDEKYLKQFVIDCKFNGKIHESIRPDRNSHTVRICLSSIKWAQDLHKNFNIIPLKTKRLAPPEHLSDELLCYFLKGYTDGDGTVYANKITNQINLNYVSSSQCMIEWVKKFTDKMWPAKLRNKENHVKKNKNYNCWHYNISGIKSMVIVDYLSQLPGPCLERKWLNFDITEMIKIKKLKYPHLFLTYNPIETSIPTNNSVIPIEQNIL